MMSTKKISCLILTFLLTGSIYAQLPSRPRGVGYKLMPYKVLKGKHLLKPQVMKVELKQYYSSVPCLWIDLQINFGLNGFKIPQIYKKAIEDTVNADYLVFKLEVTTPDGKVLMKKEGDEEWVKGFFVEKTQLCAGLLPFLGAKDRSVIFNFNGELLSHGGLKAPNGKIDLSIEIPIKVRPWYDKRLGRPVAYKVMKGQTYFKNKEIRLNLVTNYRDLYHYKLTAYANLLHTFTTDSIFKNQEMSGGDLMLKAYMPNKVDVLFQLHAKTKRYLNLYQLEFDFSLEQLSKIKPGRQTLHLFLDVNQHHMVQLQVILYVPPIFKTEIHFNYLKLNKKKTEAILGLNDFWNQDPETGLRIEHYGKVLYDGYSVNDHVLHDPTTIVLYHLGHQQWVRLIIEDKDDYTANETICKTAMTLAQMKNPKWVKYRLHCLDEIELYTKSFGRVN